MSRFGELLREYRQSCNDPEKPGRRLTQERLGELLGRELGSSGYSAAAVSDWERNVSKIHADDRGLLVCLIKILYTCRGASGISDLEVANNFLLAGNYRPLSEKEAREINPNWNITSPATPPEVISEDQSPPKIMGFKKSSAEVELYSATCGSAPINLAQQRLLVSASFGSYFTGLLERPNIYLDLESQIDCPSSSRLENLQPLQRIFWLLGYARGPRTMIIGGEGGMGKSTLSAKVIRCLYQEQAIDLILGDSAKSEHVNPTTKEIIKYQPGYYDPASFYNRLCSQLGLPSLPGKQAVEAVKDRLIGRKAIIVVDNLETVKKGDEILNSLGKITSRDVRAIVTTRQVAGVKVLGDELFVVQLQPLTDARIAGQFLLWHIEQYRYQHSALKELETDIYRHIEWLIERTGGIPLLMQLILSDAARYSWDYMQTLPSLFGKALLDFLYQTRWDDLGRQNKEGDAAKQLLRWIAEEQYRGKEITSMEIFNWAKSVNVETRLSAALSLLFERFMIINQDSLKGNFSIYPSLAEFISAQQ